MTPEERRNPRLIGGSRKRRVAVGSGTSPTEVNRLLSQFAEAQKMMRMLSSGKGLGQGLAGLPGLAGGGRSQPKPGGSKARTSKKKKSKGRR
jgi:signal recognition particle subunit SRP54